MNTTFSELKRCARKSLTGHYRVPCYTFLLAILFTTILTVILESVSGIGTPGYTPGLFQYIIYFLASFFISVLSTLLLCGRSRIHLELTAGNAVSNRDLFYAFRFHSNKFILASMLFSLVLFLCSLPVNCIYLFPAFRENSVYTLAWYVLALAGGIIALLFSLAYAFVFFLLIERPEITVPEAFRGSRELMKGRKWKFFVLNLSFIGWYLLGILSLCIGYVWIIPYVMQTYTEFYKNCPEKTK
ncbi:MAG: DUF975 family protein [Eubacterium sp.]|nr:DUF975 family protein [Eubacterium sp.]